MSVLAASAEDGLGELSGAGGVMRDAERRALAPASPARYVRQKDEVAAETSPAALPKAVGSDFRRSDLRFDRVRRAR